MGGTNAFENTYLLASFVISTIGKFSVAGTFAIIYNYTSELFPTKVRTNAVAIGSAVARIGGVAAPYIIILYKWKNWVPGTIFGIMGLLSGWLTFKLPETRGHPMLMTFEDAQDLYTGRSGEKSGGKVLLENSDSKTHL